MGYRDETNLTEVIAWFLAHRSCAIEVCVVVAGVADTMDEVPVPLAKVWACRRPVAGSETLAVRDLASQEGSVRLGVNASPE